jgi:HlyD family secretion protein
MKFVCVILLFICMFGCSRKGIKLKPKKTVVETRDIIDKFSVVGTLEPKIMVEMKSEVAGKIIAILSEEGDSIKKGKPIFKIDSEPYRNRLAKTELDLKLARLNLKKAERDANHNQALYDKQGVSKTVLENYIIERDMAEIALKKAEISVKDIREDLNRTVVRSPIDGIFIERSVEQGEIASSAKGGFSDGTLLGKVAVLSEMEIKATITEVDYENVRPGDTVFIYPVGKEDTKYPGVVTYVSSSARQKDKSAAKVFDVKVETKQESGKLIPGINVIIDFITHQALGIPTVPFDYVTSKKGKKFLVKDPGKAPVEVKTGISDAQFIEIKEGVSVGDTVYKIPGKADYDFEEFKRRNK